MSILSKSPLPFNGKIRRNDGNEQSRDKESRDKKNGTGSEAYQSDRYDRVVRVLGKNTVDLAIQTDIRREKELEQKRLEQMLQGSLSERLKWAESKRDEYNVQRKKNKVKNREMEI